MKKLSVALAITLLISALAGCSKGDGAADTGTTSAATTSGSLAPVVTEAATADNAPPAPAGTEAMSDYGDGFRVYYTPNGEYCYTVHIFSADNTLVHTEGVDELPTMISADYNGTVAVGIIYGDSMDNDAKFCNTETGEWSRKFTGYLDVADGRVLFCTETDVIVSDMFDESAYYRYVADSAEVYGARFVDGSSASVEICTSSDDGMDTIYKTIVLE